MKTLTIAALFLSCLAAVPATAQDVPSLGRYHVYFEYSAMIMQHVTFEADDAGLHVGLAGYKHVGDDWYVGAELGGGGSLIFLGIDSEITTWEVNAKRALPLGRFVCFELGGGLSYNKVHYEESHLFFDDDEIEIDDWVPGVQALANAHAKLGAFLAGAHVKYMLTGDVEGVQEAEGLEEGWDYSNVTIGVQFGFAFR